MRQPRAESLFLKPRKRGQAVRSADRFVEMSVSPRRNAQFAAESDRPSRFLNDPNEEIDPGGPEIARMSKGVKGVLRDLRPQTASPLRTPPDYLTLETWYKPRGNRPGGPEVATM